MWISRELEQVHNSAVGNLRPMLSPNDRLIFDREFSKIQDSVRNQFMKSRQRKLVQHFNPMSVSVNPTYAFKGRDIPIADLDLGVLYHRNATNEENERNLQASITKFAYLQFVWVHLLERDLSELNLSLDVNDLPTLTTPGINAWGYVY